MKMNDVSASEKGLRSLQSQYANSLFESLDERVKYKSDSKILSEENGTISSSSSMNSRSSCGNSSQNAESEFLDKNDSHQIVHGRPTRPNNRKNYEQMQSKEVDKRRIAMRYQDASMRNDNSSRLVALTPVTTITTTATTTDLSSLPREKRYEAHYQQHHSFSCSTCQRFFASEFLQDVHIQENHDSYFDVLRSKIDMYRCLVETCRLKFRSAELRRDHMVTVHGISSESESHHVLKDAKLLSNSNSSSQNETGMVATCITPSELSDMQNELEDRDKRPRKGERKKTTPTNPNPGIPKSVCFGQGSERAFQRIGRGRRHHWHQIGKPNQDTTIDIQCVDMHELADSLD